MHAVERLSVKSYVLGFIDDEFVFDRVVLIHVEELSIFSNYHNELSNIWKYCILILIRSYDLTIWQTCFGKHNSEYLLLCDYCDQESHTYCLTPQLTEIPEEAWYCGSCINLGLVKAEIPEALPTEVTSEEGEGMVDTSCAVLSETASASHLTHR